MDDFIAKPTTIPLLASKLQQWLPNLTWEPPAAAASSEDGEPDWRAVATLAERLGDALATAA